MNHAEMGVAASWEPGLVVLSYVVAVFASYTALDLAGRVSASSGKARLLWLAGGAFAMGTGIWSMHFTGMLAYNMGMPVAYQMPLTLVSIVIAIAASGLALFVVSRGLAGLGPLLLAGPVMGVGIASMHYTGMSAMRMQATISYDPFLFALSVLIAIVASIAALYLSFRLNRWESSRTRWLKGAAAFVMGAAIVGMHYTGMLAATFTPTDAEAAPAYNLNTLSLGFGVGLLTLVILGLALISAIVDRRFSAKAAQLDERTKALQESEERFRGLSDATFEGVAITENGKVLETNKAFAEMFAYGEPSDIVGNDALGLVAPDSRDVVQRRISIGSEDPYEIVGLKKDGTTFDLEIRGKASLYQGRSVLITAARDVTERKRAEDELRKSEERTRAIVDTATDAIVTMTANGIIRSFNPAAERIFGYSADEARGQPLAMLMPERFHGLHEAGFRRYLKESDAHVVGKAPVELAGLRKDGEEFPLELSLGEMRERDDILFTGIIRDITQRKKAEVELRSLNETLEIRVAERTVQLEEVVAELQESANALRLRTRAVDASSNGIVITDPNLPDNPLIYANPAFERMTGYSAEEVVGKNCRFLQGEDRDQAVLDELRDGLREGQDSTVVLRNYRKDGALFYNELTTSPVFDEEGNITNFIGVQNDVTERKRAEDEIRELNETLEIRVVERTAQLQNAVAALEDAKSELEEARDVAETANRTKSDFLANMSHEIRTPMNGVIGMTELLLDTGLSGEQREFAETVRQSGETLLAIINDILDFSKIEAGKVTLEALNFDLRATVEEVARMLAERAESKGLELINFVEYDVPTALEGDPFRLRQVLTNLLGNAIKFTGEGEVVLRTSLASESEDEAEIRFEVIDTGIGVTPEQRERLFRSFSQADTSTTRQYGGTGLGLAISKQIVELMGGSIEVESNPGEGSTFRFTVRLKKQPDAVIEEPLIGGELRGRRVLIVDDNATNRNILSKQVTPWGMLAETAENGWRAMEVLRAAVSREEPYELAILDMQMPGMNGIQLAHNIKADSSLRSTHLVMLTSMGWRGDSDEAREAGVEAYLTKPVKQADLRDALQTVIGSRVERSSSAPSQDGQKLVTRHSLAEKQAGARARLLVAEDNPVNQKVALRMLEKLGYRVDVVNNGREVLDALERVPYAAILMDVQMPEMDGYEATAEIRRREEDEPALDGENRRVPIVAMTANALKGDREKAIEAGMDDYISKPAKAEALEGILSRWVPRSEEEPREVSPQQDGAAESSLPTVDRGVLDGLREMQFEGEPDLLAELVKIFAEDASARLEDLRKALDSDDVDGFARTAHALKGSAANLGASRMAHVAARLESLGRSGSLENAEGLLEQLQQEFEKANAEFSASLLKS